MASRPCVWGLAISHMSLSAGSCVIRWVYAFRFSSRSTDRFSNALHQLPYGYREIHHDLREQGETCGRNRVGRLMQAERLRSQMGYRRRPRFYEGKPTVASPNHLARQFKVSEPNQVWVTDITAVDQLIPDTALSVDDQISIGHLLTMPSPPPGEQSSRSLLQLSANSLVPRRT